MRKHLILLSGLILTSGIVWGFTLPEAPADSPPQIIQDLKTNVIYYLESDRRHVSAISPDGKLLWCCKVIPDAAKKWHYIEHIGLWPPGVKDDYLSVIIFVTGQGSGEINKKTGVWKQDPTVQ